MAANRKSGVIFGELMNFDALLMYAARIIALLISIPVHESAHAFVSYKLGDPTAKNLGRISLNPIRHFDLMGGLCMIFAGFGWAKPVPVDTRYYKNKKVGMAISSLAGPLSNILMAYLSIIPAKSFGYLELATGGRTWYALYIIFQYMAIINITLGIFNMIPIPPFDGSRIFLLVLPERWYFGVMRYERYIMVAIFALLFTGLLDGPLFFLQNGLLRGLDFLSGFVDVIARGLLFRPNGIAV